MTKVVGYQASASAGRKHAAFLALCVLSSLILGGTWTKWLHLALSNERYTYLLLVPLLFAGMIYHSGHQIVASNEDGAKGKLLIAAGVVCWTVANWCLTNSGLIDSFTLAVFGGVTFWVGSFRLCYGRQAWKSARFPILFLYSLVPIPGFLLDRVIGVLQRGSAAVANELLSLSSVQYFREGLSFYFKDLTVVVAEDCSGIRSSITLLLWVTLQAHFSLRSGWRKLLFLSSVFPVVLFKNGLRIATLSFLAVKVDPGFMTGWLHHDGGFVFFGLALLIEIAFCRLLEKSERIESADTRDITLRPAPQIAHEIR